MRAAKPEAIWVAAATGDGVRVVSQIREAGMNQPLFTGNGSFQDPVYWDGTKGQVIGCYCWIGLDLSNPSPALKSFAERYKVRFGMDPIAFSDYGVSSVYAVTGRTEEGRENRSARAAGSAVDAGHHHAHRHACHVQEPADRGESERYDPSLRRLPGAARIRSPDETRHCEA